MDIEVRFLVTFKDGNILPEQCRIGQKMILPESKVKQIQQSGGMGTIEIVRKIIPPPVRKNDKAN